MAVLSLKKDCYVKFYFTLLPLRNVKDSIVQLMSKKEIYDMEYKSINWNMGGEETIRNFLSF